MSDSYSLLTLSNKYALDKCSTHGSFHEYIKGYEQILDSRRERVKTVLEIGIGCVERNQMSGVVRYGYKTGNSLRMWRDYFQNANIYGMDIFAEAMLHGEDRVTTFTGDQSNPTDLESIMKSIGKPLDIIIDDGSHDPLHQKFSIMFLEKYLADDGVYFIEDIQPSRADEFLDLSIFPEHFKEHLKKNYKITIFDTRHVRNRADDILMAFQKISHK